MKTLKELRTEAHATGMKKAWFSSREAVEAYLVDATVTDINKLRGIHAAETRTNPHIMSRKELLADLKAIGYEGPTSYLVPKLHEIWYEIAGMENSVQDGNAEEAEYTALLLIKSA